MQGQLVTDGSSADIKSVACAPAPAPAPAVPAQPAAQMPPAAMAQQETTQLDIGGDDEKCCQSCNQAYPLHYFPHSITALDGRAPLCYRCDSELRAQRSQQTPR